jgi:hypothetical protein
LKKLNSKLKKNGIIVIMFTKRIPNKGINKLKIKNLINKVSFIE